MKLSALIKSIVFSTLCCIAFQACAQHNNPNIVIIYVDDLGYGDIGVNGAIGVETPHIDTLAKNGLNFTDAHCSASTCTPSRYSLLTGSYAFRNKAEILEGDAPLIINPNMGTLPKMLQKAGYKTGVVGKWHLGLGKGKINWNEYIPLGPKEVGFDYSFLIPATGDRVPCVFLENQKVVGLDPNDPITVSYGTRIEGYPWGFQHPELLKQHTDPYHQGSVINGISRIGYMKGGKEALWVDENIPYVLTDKANTFISNNKDNPFFLYFALHDIHQPRIANIKFVESSTMGPRGDVIAQMDWCVGQVKEALEKQGLLENTLIIFTSDNGPILDDGYIDYARELVGDHKPGGIYRGSKYSAYEAGTRMPTVVHWPKEVKPGTSNALLSQVDLYASLASLVNQNIEKGDAVDSQNFMDSWLGKSDKGRKYLLEESYTFGFRMDNWKYITPKDKPVPNWIVEKFVDPGFRTEPQLYNLYEDPSEVKNLASEYPEIVAKMEAELKEILEQ
ncbi:sulfatase-like hydrolase/transferase [Seonamhaeicola aphaedonensis]|uniref:Arylsulfatase A-like enzyme n=1 Tax=Seonamhaeicola aphaedonensis TaxID=1461338 RepID=A0A3D9HLD7_9FLAO|nr:sulfatase-like hydrolase/transferase [Seonamhaeicola aphaedonensis]RED50322.1 arylsulfatase A-like enzyme [Seonamhaeicola aphaedonensis]